MNKLYKGIQMMNCKINSNNLSTIKLRDLFLKYDSNINGSLSQEDFFKLLDQI